MLPLSASSNLPGFSLVATVNAPRSWPNSSLSSSSLGSAAQLIFTNGFPRRGLRSCSARAIPSLPTPLSPRMSTGTSVSATRSTMSQMPIMAWLTEMKSAGGPRRDPAMGATGDGAPASRTRMAGTGSGREGATAGTSSAPGAGAEPHRLDHRFLVVHGRQRDDGGEPALRAVPAQDLEAVDAGHAQVEQHRLRRHRRAGEPLQPGAPVRRGEGVVAHPAQELDEDLPRRFVIVDHEYLVRSLHRSPLRQI